MIIILKEQFKYECAAVCAHQVATPSGVLNPF